MTADLPTLSELAPLINAAHEQAMSAAESAISEAIRCGKLLIQAKRRCEHGRFQNWIEEKCAFSYSSAHAYMRAARAKSEHAEFSSLRQLLIQNGGKRNRTRDRLVAFHPAPRFELPPEITVEDYTVTRDVFEALAHFSRYIDGLDPRQIMRGAVPQDVKKLGPMIKRLHYFICAVSCIQKQSSGSSPLTDKQLAEQINIYQWKPELIDEQKGRARTA